MQKCIAIIDNYFWMPEDKPQDKASFYKIALSVNAMALLMLVFVISKLINKIHKTSCNLFVVVYNKY